MDPSRVSVSEKLLLKDWEAAELLSVSKNTLLKLPIPRVRIEGTKAVRFKRSDIEEYVKGLAA
jgi:excisionase family DNA binding protein